MTVSLGWRAHKLRWLELMGPADSTVKIRYADVIRSVRLDARGRYRM
jgi:hypothetical protein